MHQFILVICCSFVAANASQYFISDSKLTRKQAMDNCTLATPDITVTSGVYRLTDTSLIDVPDGVTNLWLGYARAYRIFHYKGCLEINPNVKPAKVVKLEADIGLCYSTCSGNSYFGLQSGGSSSTCYCFDRDPQQPGDSTGRSCTATCSNSKDTACGGTNVISMYERVSVPHDALHANEQDTTKNCLLYQPTDPIGYEWTSCTAPRAAQCQDSVGNISTVQGGYSWIAAANTCFVKRQYTMAYHKTYPQTDALYQVWSGMLRSQFNIQTNDPAYSDVRIIGYTYYNTTSSTVKFARGDQFKAHALCVKGDLGTDEKQHDDENVGSVGVYVGASVGGVVLLVVTIGGTVIVFRRSRTKQAGLGRSTNEQNYQNTGVPTANTNRTPADNYITACYEDPTSKYENTTSRDVSIATSTEQREINVNDRFERQDVIQNNFEGRANTTYVNTDTQKQSSLSHKEHNTVKQTNIAGNYIDMSGPGQTVRDAPVTPRQEQEQDDCKAGDDSGGYYVHNIYQGLTNDTRADASHVYLQMNELPNTNHKPRAENRT